MSLFSGLSTSKQIRQAFYSSPFSDPSFEADNNDDTAEMLLYDLYLSASSARGC
jgi:hypothetical protein